MNSMKLRLMSIAITRQPMRARAMVVLPQPGPNSSSRTDGAVKRPHLSVSGDETDECYPQTYMQPIFRGRTTMDSGFVTTFLMAFQTSLARRWRNGSRGPIFTW